MLNVYSADDEEVVRQGLKKIIDWQSLGFEICGEAADGMTAYNDISVLKPELILIDIRMPKLQGLDLASRLRSEGYDGHFIVLSGYSEFKYAQEAIKCDVDYYLTKPIEEEELLNSVTKIKNSIVKKRTDSENLFYYQEKAIDKILEDIVKGEYDHLNTAKYTLADLELKADKYKVLVLKSSDANLDPYKELCSEIKIPVKSGMAKKLKIEKNIIVLLKGTVTLKRFLSYRESCSESADKGYFIAEGTDAENIEDIHTSYFDALSVFERQFFFDNRKHIASKGDLPESKNLIHHFTAQNSKELGKQLYDLIIIFKKTECDIFFSDLKNRIINSVNSADSIKSVLAGMYIYVVQEFKRSYVNYNAEFPTNAEIIQLINECTYLEEIISFIKSESHRLIQIIGGYSSETIVDEILEFMKYHYSEDIKLKTIAPKFGYNSSYLGKIFSKKLEIGFNDYLHKIRTEKAKQLLLNKKYKVYEISSLVGYKNVDYFHLKFKQFEGCTPNEYRAENNIDVD